jgi:hypothetical protein
MTSADRFSDGGTHAVRQVPPETAGGGIARLAAARARASHIDIEPLLTDARLSGRTLDNPTERIPVARQIAFLNAVSERLRDNPLGFRLAQDADLREIGLIY